LIDAPTVHSCRRRNPERPGHAWPATRIHRVARERRCGGVPAANHRKGFTMNIPVETKPALWGIVGGAVAAAIIGFTWGGWVTGSTAEAAAVQRSNAAVVVALAPLCVEKFQRGADVPGTLSALKKADSWSQGDYIEKGGWAALPGSNSPQQLSAVAKACAVLLAGA
jgi:hypothetical protein